MHAFSDQAEARRSKVKEARKRREQRVQQKRNELYRMWAEESGILLEKEKPSEKKEELESKPAEEKKEAEKEKKAAKPKAEVRHLSYFISSTLKTFYIFEECSTLCKF